MTRKQLVTMALAGVIATSVIGGSAFAQGTGRRLPLLRYACRWSCGRLDQFDGRRAEAGDAQGA